MQNNERTCAIAYSINLLGDKWTLLILRDVILHKKSRFGEFQNSREKIASNILTNRLKMMLEEGFLEFLDSAGTKKSRRYIATAKGMSVLPIIIELYLFSIDSIEQENLNDAQKKFKKEITQNRKRLVQKRKAGYEDFLCELKKG